ncbi:sensor histidine kinase [Nocardia sp. NPDC004123]
MFSVRKPTLGVRARILAIALVPSVTMLVTGIAVAGYFVDAGRHARDWAAQLHEGTTPTVAMVDSFEHERLQTFELLTGNSAAVTALAATRTRVDNALRSLVPVGSAMSALDPDATGHTVATVNKLLAQLPDIRAKVDSSELSTADAYAYYNQTIDAVGAGSIIAAEVAPDAATSIALADAASLFRAIEAMSRAHALAVVALNAGGLTQDELTAYNHEIGYFRTALAESAAHLAPAEQARLTALTSTPAWQQSVSMEETISARGVQHPDRASALPITASSWQTASGEVATGLLELWRAQNDSAQQAATDAGERIATGSLLGGAAALLLALTAAAAAVVLANRFIVRLTRLRRETLVLADERLPEIVTGLRDGTLVDFDASTLRLDHGDDEIGEVAKAFNQAQQAAVAAAIAEARTRTGINAVFLNIAHRSQVVAHRQLELLDRAEHDAEDPSHLDTLFQLDHLATRARRHAENLIILGGGKPGRQWRTPVPLIDVVRGAVAETLEYTRIRAARLPTVRVAGTVVADLIHLLAELMDNATAFSPPQTHVDVTGRAVGRGVALETTDHGLGMTADELADRNELLRNAPDFSFADRSDGLRLGMFAIAKLASRHDISVRLGESDFSGIRAVVLIPAALLTEDPRAAHDPFPTSWSVPVIEPLPKPLDSVADSGTDIPPFTNPTRPALPRRHQRDT